jgi:hypothetical protein
MKQIPYWETNILLAGKEISFLLWTKNVHYQVHKIPPLGPDLWQMTQKDILLLLIHFNSILPSMSKSHSGLLYSDLQLKFYVYSSSATYVLHSPPISSILIWLP